MNNLLIVVVFVIMLVLGPMFTILALNTLFGFNIGINVSTWFATFWIHMLIVSGYTRK